MFESAGKVFNYNHFILLVYNNVFNYLHCVERRLATPKRWRIVRSHDNKKTWEWLAVDPFQVVYCVRIFLIYIPWTQMGLHILQDLPHKMLLVNPPKRGQLGSRYIQFFLWCFNGVDFPRVITKPNKSFVVMCWKLVFDSLSEAAKDLVVNTKVTLNKGFLALLFENYGGPVPSKKVINRIWLLVWVDYQLFAGHCDKKMVGDWGYNCHQGLSSSRRRLVWKNGRFVGQILVRYLRTYLQTRFFFVRGFGRVNPFNCHLVGGFKDFCFHPDPWGRFPFLLLFSTGLQHQLVIFWFTRCCLFFTMAYHVSHCRSCCLHSEYLRKYLKRRGLFCLYVSNWVCESKMDPMGFFSNSHDLKIMKILQSSYIVVFSSTNLIQPKFQQSGPQHQW